MAVDSPPIVGTTANQQNQEHLVQVAKRNKQKKYKNTKGKKRREQKFRRDKPYYLNRFFQKQNAFKNDTTPYSPSSNQLVPYTATAQIYQAMMTYYFVKGENEFRYSEIAEWLIKGEE